MAGGADVHDIRLATDGVDWCATILIVSYSSGWQPQPATWFNEEGRLERMKDMIGSGPTAESFVVPQGLSIESSPEALRFRGSAAAVDALENEFDKLARSQPGSEVHIEGWTLRVQEELPEDVEDSTIVLPGFAWEMVGRLFSDVAYDYEPNPFDFSRVGYIIKLDADGQKHRWPQPDIGVIVEGPLFPNNL